MSLMDIIIHESELNNLQRNANLKVQINLLQLFIEIVDAEKGTVFLMKRCGLRRLDFGSD